MPEIIDLGADQDSRQILMENLTIEKLNNLIQHPDEVDNQTRLALTGFGAYDGQATSAKAKKADEILKSAFKDEAEKQNFIIHTVLTNHLRPIFSKSTTRVTSSGRPSYFQQTSTDKGFNFEEPSWMKAEVHAVPTFEWTVLESTDETVKENWPLFMPVLLTLIEASSSPVRIRGLIALKAFLMRCPPDILVKTGIDAVLEEAIFPSLLSLPNLTPEEESIPLLKAAYACLLQIATADADPKKASRRRLLDKMLRDGVFAGVHHASENHRIVELLLDTTADIVEALSVYTAKHLDNILSIISSVLIDPFAVNNTGLVLAGIRSLDASLRHCWPVFAEEDRAGEMLRMILMCWLNIHNDDNNNNNRNAGSTTDQSKIDEALSLAVRTLQVICKNRELRSFPHVSDILQREPALAAILDT